MYSFRVLEILSCTELSPVVRVQQFSTPTVLYRKVLKKNVFRVFDRLRTFFLQKLVEECVCLFVFLILIFFFCLVLFLEKSGYRVSQPKKSSPKFVFLGINWKGVLTAWDLQCSQETVMSTLHSLLFFLQCKIKSVLEMILVVSRC